jgi:hypothetical protein
MRLLASGTCTGLHSDCLGGEHEDDPVKRR